MPTATVPASTAPSPALARWSAASAVLAGLCLAVPAAIEAFTGETATTSFVIGLSPALAMPLLPALFQHQASVVGRWGEAGYLLNLIGLGLFGGAAFALNMVIFYLEPAVAKDLLHGYSAVALLGSAVVFAAGSVLFGVSLLRARVFPRLAAWGYTVLLPLFALLAPLPDSPLTSALHVLVGLTLIRLALAVRGRG